MDGNKIKDRIKKAIYKTDPHAEAYLFGSRARGEESSTSDWDVLILIDNHEITNEIEDNFREGLYEIELESGYVISAFIYPKDLWHSKLTQSPLYKNIVKEGITL